MKENVRGLSSNTPTFLEEGKKLQEMFSCLQLPPHHGRPHPEGPDA